MTFTHGQGGYANHDCKCRVCTEGHRLRMARRRAERYAMRVEVDGCLIAVGPDHGRATTYSNWGCRCQPCTDANADLSASRRARHAASN